MYLYIHHACSHLSYSILEKYVLFPLVLVLVLLFILILIACCAISSWKICLVTHRAASSSDQFVSDHNLIFSADFARMRDI